MPLARIDIPTGKSAEFKRAVGAIVYEALVDVLGAPKDDRFQIITEHSSDDLIMDPTYLGIERSPDALIIQITLNEGRTTDLKKAFYKRVADDLHSRAEVRKEDVFINLIEVKRENWSFGNGIAQYA
ncbi:tautomerase family protein [Rhizobium laguerreae]|nr:tautomerase family protein [Rhizobium laguerreae]